MKIALAQINTTVGDLEGNHRRIVEAANEARQRGAALVVFPELSITGYPPRDLVDRAHFVRRNVETLEAVARDIQGIDALVGFAEPNEADTGKPVFNSAAWVRDGSVLSTHRKSLLPTYDVFDEARHFEPGGGPGVVQLGEYRFGITVCEDIWNEEGLLPRRYYHSNPLAELRDAGVDCILNLSASPWVVGKDQFRFSMIAQHASQYGAPVLQTNLVGGNDDLIFDGNSVAITPEGHVLARGRAFEEDLVVVDLASQPTTTRDDIPSLEDPDAAYRALTLGVRDYLGKTGFPGAIIGLSGGIDSAVVAAIAAEAIGPENVLGVAMPSAISSDHSLSDAEELARLLGIQYRVIPIAPMVDEFTRALAPSFEGTEPGIAEENVQSRIRGTLLMSLSNKFGSIVLSTGNKSEMAVGYCTLYGDMNGGLSVISDVPKTLVYEISRFLNRDKPTIPVHIIEKPPSAELRPDQVDTDSLPPYEVLDPILKAYIEDLASIDEIAAAGFDRAVVEEVAGMIARNEYKRRQAALGLKVTSKAFGLGRQMPIVNRFRR